MATSSTAFRVSLPPKLKAWVTRKIRGGAYASADDVVQAAIIALQDQERRDSTARDRIRAQIEEGAACIERGDVVDGEQFFEELLRELDGANDSPQTKRGRSNGFVPARKSGRK